MSNFVLENKKRKSKNIPIKARNCTIYTDGRVTEKNFIDGLKQSINDLDEKIIVKIFYKSTKDLVKSCYENTDLDPVLREKWIMLDYDNIKDFDGIVSSAYSKGLHVAWSNPCIEIFFLAYFSLFPACSSSKSCYDKFKSIYKSKTGKVYNKKNKDLYEKLIKFGDEKNAIKICKTKISDFNVSGIYAPSKMNPSSTVFLLIQNIKHF